MLAAHAATQAAILHVTILHVFAEIRANLGHFAAIPALEQIPAHLDNLRLDDLIDVLEELGV